HDEREDKESFHSEILRRPRRGKSCVGIHPCDSSQAVLQDPCHRAWARNAAPNRGFYCDRSLEREQVVPKSDDFSCWLESRRVVADSAGRHFAPFSAPFSTLTRRDALVPQLLFSSPATMSSVVVVCGAGGFIGGHLVADLARKGIGPIRAVDIKP